MNKNEIVEYGDFWAERFPWGFALRKPEGIFVDVHWLPGDAMFQVETTTSKLFHEDELHAFSTEINIFMKERRTWETGKWTV